MAARTEQAANDAPYWPACARDPAFLSWLHRIIAIANNTRPGTPFPVLLRMGRKQGNVPPDWALAFQFMMEHARSG